MSTTDTVWSERDTTPDAIEQALRRLLVERHTENEGVAPARALNMVAFVEHAWSGEIANRMRGVGRYHASRLIVLSYDPDRDRLDARASIASEDHRPGEISLLRETVVVEIGRKHLDDLATIADPLVVSDMPTLLWSPHGHPEALDGLLPLAQAILIDSVDEPDFREAAQRACGLAKRTYVVDLAWLRSTPWRERIAAAFDPSWMRGQLRQITSVEISHHHESTIVAMLLVGWLSSRLCWRVEPLHAENGTLRGIATDSEREIEVTLRADPNLDVPGLAGVTLETAGKRAVSFERGDGGLRTRRSEDGKRERSWTILGASRGEGGILGEGIRQALLRDPTYEPALRAAGKIAG